MKISDHTPLERSASAAATPVTASSTDPEDRSPAGRSSLTSSDNAELSGLVSRLRNVLTSDPGRAARVKDIADAVRDRTFKVETTKLSSALAAEFY